MVSYTLGLDIGSHSIGWALLDTGKKTSILDIGVRVFPEGVDREKGQEKSKNATRREARGARRVHQRRNLRRDQIVKTLQSAGLLPKDDEQLKKLLNDKNPYELRKNGLDEKLKLYEFGRALFHINQRRGFKSNRKTGSLKEEGQIAKDAGELQSMIEKHGCRTLGEYFAGLNPKEQRIRGWYTFRSMYEKEFDLLWAKQFEYYPEVLADDLRKKVRNEIIFFQRPMRWDPDTIGDCQLEDGEKRCPRGDWYARRFRILQDMNNLKICNPDGTIETLTPEQRKTILDELNKKKEVRFTTIRKKLRLMDTQTFNLEYEINEKGKKREKLKGDDFASTMMGKKVFGRKKWEDMSEGQKIKLNNLFLGSEDNNELCTALASEYKLAEEKAEIASKVKLVSGYMSFSRKALQKLLPLMEEGKRTDEALDIVYSERNKTDEANETDKLDFPEDLRNPLVNCALFEVRKVVNAVVREYGKPKKIKIEMARDVRGNARQRKEIHFKMLDNKRRNEQTRKRLMEDMVIANPSRDDIIKYNLWIECGKVCPYTGKTISQEALFGPNPEFQIEHILPYDRSLDDSYMNKTLCEVYENIHVKKKQTPYETYSGDTERFEQLKQRVNRTAMPYWKKQKFWQKEIDTDKIISRELNDTRYINREVVKYLRQICSDVNGTRGKTTAELAYQWGFIKDREDHRHHSVDAAVIAVTGSEHLRQLGKSKYSDGTISFPPPWPHFREELAEKVKHINVSHRATKKASGKLHEETFYGLTKKAKNYFKKADKEKDIKRLSNNAWLCRRKLNYVYSRTPAEILKKVKDIDEITEDARNVKDAIRKKLIESGIDIYNKRSKIPKELFKETLYLQSNDGKRIPIKKIRVETSESNMVIFTDRKGNPYRACPTGGNHHIEIFEYTDQKGKKKRVGRVITMFEAVQRRLNEEPIIQKDYEDDKKFICSLAQNEMFMLEIEDGEQKLYRVQKITQSGNNITIVLRPHTYSGKVSDYDKPPIIQRRSPNTLKGHKVTVDMLGRVLLAND